VTGKVVTIATSVRRAVVAVVVARPRVMRVVLRVQMTASRLWRRAILPLLQAVALAAVFTTAFVALVYGLMVAPLLTLLAYAVVIGVVFLLALAWRALEEREARGSVWAARVLNAVDFLARIGYALGLVAAGVLTVVLCATSLGFAVFVALDVALSYFAVRGASTIAFLASCLVTGQWELALAWLAWRAIRGGVISEREPAVAPEYSEIRRRSAPRDAEVVEETVETVAEEIVAEAPERGRVLIAKDTEEIWDTETLRTAIMALLKPTEQEYSEIRRRSAPRDAEVVEETVETVAEEIVAEAPERGRVLIAKGTEEMWGTDWDTHVLVHDDADEGRAAEVTLPCASCGRLDAGTRVRSLDHRVADARRLGVDLREWDIVGLPHAPDAMLCEGCFVAECEDTAIAYTGVSLKVRGLEVSLTRLGLEASSEYGLSRALAAGALTPVQHGALQAAGWKDGDPGVWGVVTWWRHKNDRAFPAPRAWACLHDGIEIARVRLDDHRRNVFSATVLGTVLPRTWSSEGAAKSAVHRALRAHEAVVARKVGKLETAGTPATQGA
jgi:hypothetical protein